MMNTRFTRSACALLVLCAPITLAAPPAELADQIRAAQENNTLHGSIILSAENTDPLEMHNGRVREPSGDRIDTNTRFRIASLTKLYTQTAVLRLAQVGKLDLDESVSTYRPELQAEWKDQVTIRQLLAMTSGLPRELHERPEMGVEYDADGFAGPYLDRHAGVDLQSQPGARSSYSNLGYWILGAIIEAVTEKTWIDSINELIAEPLGIEPLALSPDDLREAGHARAHRSQRGRARVMGDIPIAQRYSSGGLCASATQLHALAQAIHSGELFTDDSRVLLFSSFDDEKSDNKILIAGMVPGFMNLIVITNDPPTAVISLNNQVAENPNDFMELIETLSSELAQD